MVDLAVLVVGGVGSDEGCVGEVGVGAALEELVGERGQALGLALGGVTAVGERGGDGHSVVEVVVVVVRGQGANVKPRPRPAIQVSRDQSRPTLPLSVGGAVNIATDDAALVEQHGGRVVVVPGTARNLKITVADDVEIATALLGMG